MYLYISDGYYYYIESSFPRKNGDKARLISSAIKPPGGCFQFWYYMYGDNINTLNVYVQTTPNLGLPIWTKSRTQGNQWNLAQINIKTRSQYKVRKRWRSGTKMSNQAVATRGNELMEI